MEKRYLFSAYWRKEDVEFLKQFKLSRNIQEGFKGFTVDEKTHDLIMMRYNKKNIFRSIKPKEFQVIFTGVTFTQEEIDNAKYYVLYSVGDPIGYPQPEQGYAKQVFDFKECNFIRNKRKQKAPFRIKKPKWKKNQLSFSLHWEHDILFFKREVYEEIFAPQGLKCIDVLDHKTGKPLECTIQLDIPTAKSKLLIDGTAFDIYEPNCGVKQYSGKTLDFFPPFENNFEFNICYTQEEFDNGYKRILISKEFCKLLVEAKIIKYEFGYLSPMKSPL
ncbi:hypothetical protein EV195_11226 [Tenacibaculum skagerrakense]|uniref:Uncharacterized protein n=1 Tax=Tenacibaculum skagerrakense TaxID=186571 RepID=A0A4R2NLE5_9FLAO|nr:hypothetical protein [Tenacibaculum skagerrakense]TCP22377.1 hypothetical protein EV195_11226 [Tenacibaculum skagerrakense]